MYQLLSFSAVNRWVPMHQRPSFNLFNQFTPKQDDNTTKTQGAAGCERER